MRPPAPLRYPASWRQNHHQHILPSHYDDYRKGTGLPLAIDLRQSDLLSFALNWKQDVHREKGAHRQLQRQQRPTGGARFCPPHLRAEFELGHGFSVNASVNNLFDTQYYSSEGFIEERRNYWTGIAYTV